MENTLYTDLIVNQIKQPTPLLLSLPAFCYYSLSIQPVLGRLFDENCH